MSLGMFTSSWNCWLLQRRSQAGIHHTTDNIRTSAYTKRPQAVSQRMCYTLCTCSKRYRQRSVSIRAAAARSWWRQRPSSVLRFARHCAGASVRDRLASAVPAKRPRTKRHDPHIRARAGPTTRCTRLGGRHFARLDAPLAGRYRSDRERRRQPRLFFSLHLSLDWKNFFPPKRPSIVGVPVGQHGWRGVPERLVRNIRPDRFPGLVLR